jgi:hypothetical protein
VTRDSQVRARRPIRVEPDGCGPVTATGNRDNKEILYMSGPMSERAPDITVEADGRAESKTVLFVANHVSESCFRVTGMHSNILLHIHILFCQKHTS